MYAQKSVTLLFLHFTYINDGVMEFWILYKETLYTYQVYHAIITTFYLHKKQTNRLFGGPQIFSWVEIQVVFHD